MLSHPPAIIVRVSGRAGPWLARNGGSLVLVLLGGTLLVASLFQGGGNEAYGVGLLIFGSGLVTVGVVLPRLRNAEVGPATGFKLTLDEQRALSTGLAESGLAESGDATYVEVDQVVAATRVVLASETLGRLLAPEAGPLAGAWFHLYLFDEQRESLLPAFEGRPSPSQGWKPGLGAVGRPGCRGSTCWSGARRSPTTPTASRRRSSIGPGTWRWWRPCR